MRPTEFCLTGSISRGSEFFATLVNWRLKQLEFLFERFPTNRKQCWSFLLSHTHRTLIYWLNCMHIYLDKNFATTNEKSSIIENMPLKRCLASQNAYSKCLKTYICYIKSNSMINVLSARFRIIFISTDICKSIILNIEYQLLAWIRFLELIRK
jgi:hypothetical protein